MKDHIYFQLGVLWDFCLFYRVFLLRVWLLLCMFRVFLFAMSVIGSTLPVSVSHLYSLFSFLHSFSDSEGMSLVSLSSFPCRIYPYIITEQEVPLLDPSSRFPAHNFFSWLLSLGDTTPSQIFVQR